MDVVFLDANVLLGPPLISTSVTVESTFSITGRGLAVAGSGSLPEMPPGAQWLVRGRTPDGVVLERSAHREILLIPYTYAASVLRL